MNKHKGFSLIELMIVIAVVGILASIAVPSYQEHIRKSKRADAQGALYGLSAVMERFFTENNTYCGTELGGVVDTCATGAPGLFSSQVPIDAGDAFYNLTISAVTATTYTLTATAVGSMANDSRCANLTLTSTGVQGTTGTQPLNYCWP